MNHPYKLLLITLILLTNLSCKKVHETPNIIFILVDDLDFNEVNFYEATKFPSYVTDLKEGRKPCGDHYFDREFHMPTIDKLAQEGVIFDRFYTNSPVCTPSRYITLTGKYPHQNRYQQLQTDQDLISFGTFVHPKENNIARQLKSLGYVTGYFGKWHNGMNKHHVFLREHNPDDQSKHQQRRQENYHQLQAYLQDSIGFDVADRLMSENKHMLNMDWISEGINQFIENNHDSSFYIYVSLPVPHGPYMDLKNLNTLYTSKGELEQKPNVKYSLEDARKENEEQFKPTRFTSATWLDMSVRNLMKKLEEHNIEDNTLIIFTSDHQSRGKYTAYEAARVPTFFLVPR